MLPEESWSITLEERKRARLKAVVERKAHITPSQIRQSRPDSGLGLSHFQYESLQGVPSLLGSGSHKCAAVPRRAGCRM